MKRIIAVFALLILSASIWAAQPYVDYGAYKKGQVVVLFGDKVNVRKSPDAKAQVLDRLPVSANVQIIEKSTEVLTINGYTESWYKVKYPCTCGKAIKEGYIWGGLLSKAVVILKPGERYTPQVMAVGVIGSKNDKNQMEARLIKDYKVVSSIQFEGMDMTFNHSFDYSLYAEMIPSQKHRMKLDLYRLDFEYAADEFPMGDIILVRKGNELIYGFPAPRAFSEFGSVDFKYIWPRDKKGKTGSIILEYTSENYEEKNKDVRYEEYKWNGAGFDKKE